MKQPNLSSLVINVENDRQLIGRLSKKIKKIMQTVTHEHTSSNPLDLFHSTIYANEFSLQYFFIC